MPRITPSLRATPSDPYNIEGIAWEHSADPRMPIERGFTQRLRLLTTARAPFAVWFWTSRSHSYSPDGHAAGWRMTTLTGPLTFTLVVYNVDTDVSVVKAATAAFDGDRIADFTLRDVQPAD